MAEQDGATLHLSPEIMGDLNRSGSLDYYGGDLALFISTAIGRYVVIDQVWYQGGRVLIEKKRGIFREPLYTELYPPESYTLKRKQ